MAQFPGGRRCNSFAAGAASLAAGCSRPDEEIVANDTLEELPYVRMPEGLVPGVTQRYATALPLAGYGRGALVTSFEGRPIKVEGNPRHPASLGSTDVFARRRLWRYTIRTDRRRFASAARSATGRRSSRRSGNISPPRRPGEALACVCSAAGSRR